MSEIEDLIGKTIVAATAEDAHERIQSFTLVFDDGSLAKIDYWAEYADDASLRLEVTDS